MAQIRFDMAARQFGIILCLRNKLSCDSVQYGLKNSNVLNIKALKSGSSVAGFWIVDIVKLFLYQSLQENKFALQRK